jgi:hypothetical protein
LMNSTNDREPEPIFQAGHAGSIPVARSFYALAGLVSWSSVRSIASCWRLVASNGA